MIKINWKKFSDEMPSKGSRVLVHSGKEWGIFHWPHDYAQAQKVLDVFGYTEWDLPEFE